MPLLLVTESGQEISKAAKKVASQAGGCPHELMEWKQGGVLGTDRAQFKSWLVSRSNLGEDNKTNLWKLVSKWLQGFTFSSSSNAAMS